MFDLKYSLTGSLVFAWLVVAAPACIESDDDDDGTQGTGGSPTGAAGEAGAPASSAGAPSGGSSDAGGAGGSAGEPAAPTAGSDGEAGGAAPNPSDGGSTSGGADPGEPTEAGAGGAGEGGSGAGGAPTGGTSTGGASGVPEKWGVVILSQTEQLYPAPINLLRASGAVAVFGLTSGDGTCNVVELGACQLHTGCTSGTAQPTEGFDAGTVTITGFEEDLPLEYDSARTSYMSAAISDFLWTSSQSATVTVEGSADVPGYEMELDLPNPIEVTAPLADAQSTYTISKGADLRVTWTGGVEGFVMVGLGSGSEEENVQIVCIVDADEGEVSVPESFLSQLGETGVFGAEVTNVIVDTVQDWTMQFQATVRKDVGTATFTE